MIRGHHPIHKYKHTKNNRILILMDKSMYMVALISPVMTIPQVVSVYYHHVAGVSLATWTTYTITSILWLLYGVGHKNKPIIFSNILSFVLDGSIVFFVLLYH